MFQKKKCVQRRMICVQWHLFYKMRCIFKRKWAFSKHSWCNPYKWTELLWQQKSHNSIFVRTCDKIYDNDKCHMFFFTMPLLDETLIYGRHHYNNKSHMIQYLWGRVTKYTTMIMSHFLSNEVYLQNNDDGINRTTKVTCFTICEDKKTRCKWQNI
jgi:hypothetical protein